MAHTESEVDIRPGTVSMWLTSNWPQPLDPATAGCLAHVACTIGHGKLTEGQFSLTWDSDWPNCKIKLTIDT